MLKTDLIICVFIKKCVYKNKNCVFMESDVQKLSKVLQ